ncbi:DNA topoisomerase IB, partial [Micromonospora lupini]
MRLRRSDPGRPGYGRRRRGKGWTFVDPSGAVVRDPATLARL